MVFVSSHLSVARKSRFLCQLGSIRQFALINPTKPQTVIEPIKKIREIRPTIPSNSEYWLSLKKQRKIIKEQGYKGAGLKFPEIDKNDIALNKKPGKLPKDKLRFHYTGYGETPSSILRHPLQKLRKEVLVKREKIPTSVKKLVLLTRLIRRMTVEEALAQLRFSKKRWARELTDIIEDGCKQAEISHDLMPESLYIASCFATRAFQIKLIRIHGRGGRGTQYRKHSHLVLILRDLDGKPVENYQLHHKKLIKPHHLKQSPVPKLQRVLLGLE